MASTTDCKKSELFPLRAAADYFPKNSVTKLPVSPASLHEWANGSLVGGVKLETIILDGRRHTTRAAVEKFLAERAARGPIRHGMNGGRRKANHNNQRKGRHNGSSIKATAACR